MTRITIILYFVISTIIFANAKRLITEEDEAKYLENLKARELQLFEDEQRMQSEKRNTKYMSAAQMGVSANVGGSSASFALPPELRPRVEKKEKNAPRHEALTAIDTNVVDEFGEDQNWCYACVTPIDKLRTDMRKSIRSLFEMRRIRFPKEDVTPECLSGRNLTALKKKKCSYKYCQSLSIVDRNAGTSFVARGCAEHFGAMSLEALEERSDYSCDMIHEKLEIKECICKTAKYCNAGWKKRSAASSVNLNIFITVSLSLLAYFFC